MVKRIFTKDEYEEYTPLYVRSGVQYYLMRVNPQEQEDGTIIAIEEVVDHIPTEDDKVALYNSWLSMEQRVKVSQIEEHAKSNTIKVFSINGTTGWIDSDDRGSIRRAASDKADEGRDTFTLYLSGKGFEIAPSKVEEILKAVEVYASDCFDVTEAHKANVMASDNIENVNGYNFETGYPDYPQFEV